MHYGIIPLLIRCVVLHNHDYGWLSITMDVCIHPSKDEQGVVVCQQGDLGDGNFSQMLQTNYSLTFEFIWECDLLGEIKEDRDWLMNIYRIYMELYIIVSTFMFVINVYHINRECILIVGYFYYNVL